MKFPKQQEVLRGLYDELSGKWRVEMRAVKNDKFYFLNKFAAIVTLPDYCNDGNLHPKIYKSSDVAQMVQSISPLVGKVVGSNPAIGTKSFFVTCLNVLQIEMLLLLHSQIIMAYRFKRL